MEQLTCKSLMIGDWVHVEAHRGFNAQNVKVETIPDNDGDNKYGHHYGHIGTWLDGGDNDFRDVEANHLQPIPLTPEILEKNGFIKCANGHILELEHGMVCSYDNLFGFHIVNCPDLKPVSKFDGVLLYVHQLQHALRVCGIEKEITL